MKKLHNILTGKSRVYDLQLTNWLCLRLESHSRGDELKEVDYFALCDVRNWNLIQFLVTVSYWIIWNVMFKHYNVTKELQMNTMLTVLWTRYVLTTIWPFGIYNVFMLIMKH